MNKQITTILSPVSEQTGEKKTPKVMHPLVIPWEDGVEFKLTAEYLKKFVSSVITKKEERQCNTYLESLYGDVLTLRAYYKGETGELGIKLRIGDEGLEVISGCHGNSKGLCKDAYFIIKSLLKGEDSEFLFKEFYFPTMMSLGEPAFKFFHFETRWWSKSCEMRPHPQYGLVYQINEPDQSVLRPISFMQQNHPATVLVYCVPSGRIWDNIPVLVPFFAERNANPRSKIKYVNFQKSFVFEGRPCYQYVRASCHALNSISHEMVELLKSVDSQVVNHRHYVMPVKALAMGETTEEEVKDADRFSLIKKQVVLKLWAEAIPHLRAVEVFRFQSNRSNMKLIRPLNEALLAYSFSELPVDLRFRLRINDDHFLFRLDIHADNQILPEPIPIGRHWLLLRDRKETVFHRVRSVQDAEVIKYMSRSEFKLTVLPHAIDRFRIELLDSLLEYYPMEIDGDSQFANFSNEGRLHFLQKRVLLTIHEELLLIRPMCVYSHSVLVNPLYSGNIVLLPNGGKTEVYLRDKEIENSFRNLLVGLHPDFANQVETGNLYLATQQIKKGVLLAEIVKTLQDHQVELLGLDNLLGFQFNPHPIKWNMDIGGDKDWFDIGLDVWFGKQRVSLELLEKSIRRSEELVELPDGSIGLLPTTVQQKLKPLLIMGEPIKKRIRLSAKHFVIVQPFANKIDDPKLREQSRLQRDKLQSLDKIQPIPQPSSVKAILRPYQEAGFSWMGFLREFGWGGILADDMGLGKTLQVLTVLDYHYQQMPEAAASLIVVPNSLLFNWQQEIQKFVPHRPVYVHHGISRKPELGVEAGQLVLTTYGTLISDIGMLETKQFSYLVLDESQAIKNPQSKRFACAQAIHADYRVAMTGTPIENGISDLFAQLDFVNPGFLGSYSRFKKNFPGIADGTASSETRESLQRVISPFLLRRTKKQVAKDLPEKAEMLLYCDMLPEQRQVYERYRQHFRGELEAIVDEGMDKAKFFVLEGLMKLRQVCNSPALVKGEKLPNASAKLSEIREHILEKTQGHKLLMFSSFTAMLGLLKDELEALGMSYAYLDGKTPIDQRQAEVAKFQEEADCRVFLISLKAGGTGLNLTAADYVYIIDPWWNPAAEAQAIDRCYRIGQDKHVMAYRMICRDSIEEKIVHMQADKKELADSLIQTDGNVLKSLNKDDLLHLFD